VITSKVAARLFLAVVGSAAAAGCGAADRARTPAQTPSGPRTTGDASSPLETATDELVVNCTATGATLSSAAVVAQRDGVHLRVRLAGAGAQTVVDLIEPPGVASTGGITGDAVVDAAPGHHQLVCADPASPDADAPGSAAYRRRLVSFAVLDPTGVYVPYALQCPDGRTTGVAGSFASGTRGVPAAGRVEAVQRNLPLKTDDVTELAGYPDARGGAVFRVLRAGRTVATAHFIDDGHDGWLLDESERCTALFG
jgi:hypothetical protein